MEETKTKLPPQNPEPDTRPTVGTIALCLGTILVLQGISAVTGKETPLVVYGIIGGVLFGIGNIKNLWGGGK